MTKKEKDKKLDWLKNNEPFNWDDTKVNDEVLCAECLYWFRIYEYEIIIVSNVEGLCEKSVCPFCKKSEPDNWIDKATYDILKEQDRKK
jgi:hypothetical protein